MSTRTGARGARQPRGESALLPHLRALIESFTQVRGNGAATLMSVAVMAIALALPAMLYGFVQNQQALSAHWGAEPTLTAFLEREASEEVAQDLARRLRETVWEYNLQRSRLCAKGLFTEVSCGPAYEPVWIAEPDSVTPTMEEVQSRSDAVGREVMRLWNAVCTDARSRESDDQERMLVCAIE